MYELDGEDAVYEMQDGDLRQEISTENPRPGMPSLKLRYDVKGEEHSKELEGSQT